MQPYPPAPQPIGGVPRWVAPTLVTLAGLWAVGVTAVGQPIVWVVDEVLGAVSGYSMPAGYWPGLTVLTALVSGAPAALAWALVRRPVIRAIARSWSLAAGCAALLGLVRLVPWSVGDTVVGALEGVVALLLVLGLRRWVGVRYPANDDRVGGVGVAVAAACGLVVLLPWWWVGAFGGPLDVAAAAVAAFGLGWLVSRVRRTGPLRVPVGGRVAGLVLDALVLAVPLTVLAGAFGAPGTHLLLLAVLPPTCLALASTDPARRWSGVVLVTLVAFGPLALVDAEEVTLLLLPGDVPQWAAIGAVIGGWLALIVGAVVALTLILQARRGHGAHRGSGLAHPTAPTNPYAAHLSPGPWDPARSSPTHPSPAQSGAAHPSAAQPGTAQPSAAHSAAVQSGAAHPSQAQPEAAQPSTAQPGSEAPDASPGVALSAAQEGAPVEASGWGPDAAPSAAAHPSAAQPDAARPSAAHSAAAQPGTAQPFAAQPGAAQPGAAQPGAAQPGAAQPAEARPGGEASGGALSGAPDGVPIEASVAVPEAAPPTPAQRPAVQRHVAQVPGVSGVGAGSAADAASGGTSGGAPPARAGVLGRVLAGALVVVMVAVSVGLWITAGQTGFHGDRLFVILKSQANTGSVANTTTDLTARRSAVYRLLVENAKRTQAPLLSALRKVDAHPTSYYLINAIEVDDTPLVRGILSAEDAVAAVRPNPELRPVPEAANAGSPDALSLVGTPPNLGTINAPEAWREGIDGRGVTVGFSDSGVDVTHPELRQTYRGGDDSWYDPWNHTPSPTDPNGHGTHTAGTAVGKTVGVAPGAKWVACANLARPLANPAYYLSCLQFMLAPFPAGGDPFTDGDPRRAADVLSNSWGCPEIEGCGADTLEPAVDALRDAGIFVVAAAGNTGANCKTITDPIGRYDSVFTVGAVDDSKVIADFSSRGPVPGDAESKPDLTAPGVDVLSAWPGGGYSRLSGTSMATPHVAGVVALIWQVAPSLRGDITRTAALLRASAQGADAGTNGSCSGSVRNVIGAGTLDAAAAVTLARQTVPRPR